MAQLTVKQYADLRRITTGAVRNAIRFKWALPGVTSTNKFGKAHILNVSEGFIRQQKKVLKKVG